jgi:hypothetical protein
MSTTKQIIDKLDHIKSDLDYIKQHMKDVDFVLTDDDLDAIREAKEDLNQGKTKRL